jgi:pyridoxamine 5'-phosphate oxidase
MTSPALPEPLCADPLPVIRDWLAEAARFMRAPTAMALATVDPDGRPSARMVICRGFDVDAGWLVFYTDRESRKGRALDVHPRAALVFHCEALERQIRVEGPVTVAPDAQADDYWRSRPADARIATVASAQSQPIATRAALLARVEAVKHRFAADAPRPERWIGYRVWADTVELWVGQPARAHDRAVWTRELMPVDAGFKGAGWRATRLQP